MSFAGPSPLKCTFVWCRLLPSLCCEPETPVTRLFDNNCCFKVSYFVNVLELNGMIITWSLLNPGSFFCMKLSCFKANRVAIIRKMAALNCPTTSTFLKRLLFLPVCGEPFNTFVGWNEERYAAG